MLNGEELDGKVELIGHYIQKLEGLLPFMEKLAEESQSVRDHVISQITKFAMSMKTGKLDKDALNGFLDYPYHIYQEKNDKANEWHIAIPKMFSQVNLGWLDKVTPGFNVFLVNRFSDWFGFIPQAIKNELKMKDPLDLKLTVDKKYLAGKDIEKAKERYAKFIKRQVGDQLEIDPTKYFQFLARLIDDGIMPFTPAPIPKTDIFEVENPKFDLRPYQKDAWDALLQYGNIGVYYPPSTGKTFIGMYAVERIRSGRKRWLIVVPRTTLIEQWRENFQDFTQVPDSDYVVVTYQTAIKKHLDEEFTGMIIDESHHMPSDYFAHLSQVKRNYTIGLTATPQREDGREDYIVALTGKPIGLSWDYFRQYGIIQSPESHIWIVRNEEERLEKLETIIKSDYKITLIFSDSLKLGERIKKEMGIEFVYGETKDKLAKVREELDKNGIVAGSRILDEGVSLKKIQRVIEVSWLFGSRHQELQRMTRLLHAADKKNPGIHHVIMLAEEWNRDHKRFWSTMDKGFKIVVHREGEEEKTFHQVASRPSTKEPKAPRVRVQSLETKKKAALKDHEPANDFEMQHPILSLPGIQKKLLACTKAERLSVRIFYQFPEKTFSKEDIWNRVGLGRVRDFASFDKLLDLGLIRKVGLATYQAA